MLLSLSRLAGWVLMALGSMMVPLAAALNQPGLQALAIIVLLAATAALSASLKEDSTGRWWTDGRDASRP
ncbi:hypothetical protein D4740_04035 [Actinomyces sp. 2119]|uniref:Uncharacterized protein n=1 Tax=Actinomyces lilanjuaniae TaxID=2321394 RepID=A0ABM6Z3G2_9ACTO|nr:MULTISPECIES: hypothetical protein [Actinomyces]AYD89579.1 hypothetical protein D5R93_05030 [Actinomyces lilanjuaniae]RJF43055.1 hypothetical protein D4740_04035 [Actinomyces sp. 2119]